MGQTVGSDFYALQGRAPGRRAPRCSNAADDPLALSGSWHFEQIGVKARVRDLENDGIRPSAVIVEALRADGRNV